MTRDKNTEKITKFHDDSVELKEANAAYTFREQWNSVQFAITIGSVHIYA